MKINSFNKKFFDIFEISLKENKNLSLKDFIEIWEKFCKNNNRISSIKNK